MSVNFFPHFPNNIYKQTKKWWSNIKKTKFAEVISDFGFLVLYRYKIGASEV